MDTGMRTYGDELVAVLSAATAVLSDLPARVHRLTGPDLDAVLPLVDRLAAVAAAGRFTITADAVDRGEVASSQAGSTQQWVADRCPSLDARDAGLVAKAVRELTDQSGPGQTSASRLAALGWRCRRAGCRCPPAAWSPPSCGSWPRCWSRARSTRSPPAWSPWGRSTAAAGVRRVRPALLARYGLGQRLQDLEDRHRGLTVLSCGHDIGGGITEYRMRLNPEARAVVEAAINVLSPNPAVVDGGTRPPHHRPTPRRRPRPGLPARRRVDTSADRQRHRTGLDPDPDVLLNAARPTGAKATVLVTIGLDDLKQRTRPGVLVGGVDAGTLLGPETVRRLACDGTLIAAILATDGQLSCTGDEASEYFTSAQIRALWLRDRHCTFPGCHAPATWCDAHHLRHWLDGGPTDLTNGTLLCERHHTIVHRDRLTATLTATDNGPQVVWDRRPGSYDRALAREPSSGPAP